MQYVNVNEASEILNVNEETVRRWIRSGKLKAEKYGGRIGYRIDKKVLDNFILENKFWKPHADYDSSLNNKSSCIICKTNNPYYNSKANPIALSGCAATVEGSSSLSVISSILGSVLGSVVGHVSKLNIINTTQTSSSTHTNDINICHKDTLKLHANNINSLIETINFQIESLIDNNFTITDKNYINFLDNISKLQSELSVYLYLLEEFKLKSLNITEDKITSNNK